MNENNNMPNDNSMNQTEDSNYSYKFDPNTSDEEDNYAQENDSTNSNKFDPNTSDEKDNYAQENVSTNSNGNYLGGYQLNQGKGLVRTKSPSSPFAKNPYGNGIRGRIGSIGNSNGYWGRGAISVLGIAIILGILVLVITFLAK